MKKLFYVVIYLFTVIVCYGCCGSKQIKSERQLLRYAIVLGSGGGFTGSYGGIAIDSCGIVQDWEGRAYLTSVKRSVDTLTANQITKLNKFFSENDFSDIQFKESGNITSFLSLSNSKNYFTFSWKEPTIPETAPGKIRELYYLLNQAIGQIKKEVQK